MELEEIRKKINETDDEIIELFKRRMELSALVADYKKEHGIEILNAAREEEILHRIGASVPTEFSEYFIRLYKTIFEVSRDYQKVRQEFF